MLKYKIFIQLTLILLLSCKLHTGFSQTQKQSGWQQKVDHNIRVKLDPDLKELRAKQDVTYTNNSPDELSFIMFHVWPNAFANRHTPFGQEAVISGNKVFYHAKEAEFGNLQVLNFMVGDQILTIERSETLAEIIKVNLPKPLKTGETVVISADFIVDIPKLFSRLGYAGNLYSITQWYPKPAVYDVNGWNTFVYQAQGEYYSEYGNYKVEITLPANYRVGATGVLQEKAELDWMTDLSEGDPDERTDKELKTIHFEQDNVHDFAWFACPEFNVAKGATLLPDGKNVQTWALYKPVVNLKKGGSPTDGKSILSSIETALTYYSKRVGGYPYKQCTVVVGPLEGAGGMEYPMVTICASADAGTVIHEVGHNWFQGILGSNERIWPWMDESINTFYHQQAQGSGLEKFSPGDRIKPGSDQFNFRLSHDLGLLQSGTLRSEAYQQTNYGTIVYGANPQRFAYLQEYLSRDIFDSCMKHYFNLWQYRHPLPGDIQAAFEEVAKQDLNWFFTGLLAKGAPDYAIRTVKRKSSGIWVFVNSKQPTETPVRLDYQIGNNVKGMWLKGRDTAVLIPENAMKVVLNASGYLTESNLANNQANTRGIFKTWGKTVIRLPYLMTRGENRVWLFPNVFSANSYDGYMPGIILSNFSMPRRNWEWWVTPMYGLKSKIITGFGRIQRNVWPTRGMIGEIDMYVRGARFSFKPETELNAYNRLSPGVDLYFRRTQPHVQNKLSFELSVNRLDHTRYLGDTFANNVPIGKKLYPYDPNLENEIFRITYTSDVYKKLQPARYKVMYEYGNGLFGKLSGNAEMYIPYPNRPKKNIGLRLLGYFNSFLWKETEDIGLFAIPISGANGSNDYAYTTTMFHRSSSFDPDGKGIWGNQLLADMPGVRMPLRRSTSTFVAGATVQSHVVPILPIMLFFDGAISTEAQAVPGRKTELFYAAGITYWGHFDLQTRFEINLPLVYSQMYKDWMETNSIKPLQLITFKVALDILSPMNTLRSVYR